MATSEKRMLWRRERIDKRLIPMSIQAQIDLILRQATPTRLYQHKLGTHPQVIDPVAYRGQVGPETYVDRYRAIDLVSEPALLIQRLYGAVGSADRAVFGPSLLAGLNARTARVVARSLIAIGDVEVVGHVTRLDEAGLEFWRGVIHVLRFEPHLLADAELNRLEVHAKRVHASALAEAHELLRQRPPGDTRLPDRVTLRSTSVGPDGKPLHEARTLLNDVTDELFAVIARVRYLRLAENLQADRNPALDRDRATLVTRLQALGLSEALVKASDEIERRSAIVTSETDIKAVMDLVRTFLEELFEESSRKVEDKVGTPAPAGPRVNHFAPYRQYLEDAGIIGREEGELFQKLYNFLSNQGAHKLTAAPELLRVAHATVIEWCMLLVGRVQSFLSI